MNVQQDKFVEYYKTASLQRATVDRLDRIRNLIVSVLGEERYQRESLKVADIGCGAGMQAVMWAKDGHEVHGLDINQGLIDEARKRAAKNELDICYLLGSADQLPWPDASMDVCLVPELLEHVQSWEKCLDEFARILRPGGVLYLSTTNRLCPKQQEFELPLYSWYPGPVKRYCERLAVTTRPQWVEYAKFPAINWFDFYRLSREFRARGMRALDRVDIYARAGDPSVRTKLSKLISAWAPLRFLLQVVTPYTQIVGVVQGRGGQLA